MKISKAIPFIVAATLSAGIQAKDMQLLELKSEKEIDTYVEYLCAELGTTRVMDGYQRVQIMKNYGMTPTEAANMEYFIEMLHKVEGDFGEVCPGVIREKVEMALADKRSTVKEAG